MLVKDIVALYNVKARTEYNRSYQDMEPEFKSLVFEYNSGFVSSIDFPFTEFLKGMEEFTGTRTHQLFPIGYKFTVTNKEYDMALDIPIKDLERAAEASNAGNMFPGLDLFSLRISEMAKQAKDDPYERAFEMLEAGDANTYGVCFDQQNLYDTTHSYTTSAGSQSNIVAGTAGDDYTSTSLHADIITVMSTFASFTYQQGGSANKKLRKLNSKPGKILIIAPSEMEGLLFSLQQSEFLASGVSNTVRNKFTYVTRPFTDTDDWYAIYQDSETMFKPFLYQIEKPTTLDMPSPQDDIAREKKAYTYGAYGRYVVAYGAWWKTIMIQN